jgi:hypothetical protein
VTVFRVDLDRRTLDFRLVEVGGRVARGGGRAPRPPNTTKRKTSTKTSTKTKSTSRGKTSRSQASGKSGKRAGKKRRHR